MEHLDRGTWPRRRVLKFVSMLGVGAAFSRAFVALAEGQPKVTKKLIRQAEWVSGVTLDDEKRKLMLGGVNEMLADFAAVRAVPLDNSVAPALVYRPVGDSGAGADETRAQPREAPTPAIPESDEDLAFLPLTSLSRLIRSRKVSSTRLTKVYLERLERFDPQLECVISLTEELALEQARRADRELEAGFYRGPLHGIPWGAKDLLAIPGYRTTWGAKPFENRDRGEEHATAASRLAEAGAVLVAKLTLGALAWGDVWYGGMTKNPWNLEQGSSGSSAGPGAATAAGLVGFSIGSETWGSIVSPCTRCGVTGLRPTFGAVSRHGAMALSWSMDKLGPVTRSVEDCALVFDVIRGPDGLDPSVVRRPFRWPPERDPRTLKLGYVRALFEEDRAEEIEAEEDRAKAREWQAFDKRTLDRLRELGMQLMPIELPATYPVGNLSFILSAEAAAAFDELTRSGEDARLVRQVEFAWPNVFRQAQLIPAV